MEKLKPCPFCGGEARINIFAHGWGGYSVSCSNIYKCGATQEKFDTAKEAIKSWNKRVNTEGRCKHDY